MAKLTLTQCTVESGQVKKASPSNSFEVTINPADFKHGYGLEYSGTQPNDGLPIAKSAKVAEFKAIKTETVGFSLVLDCTGVVPGTADLAVSDQIDKIRTICYTYSGKEHEPNVVMLDWGKSLSAFQGRLTSMNVNYTLFQADGTPLRAKVALEFMAYSTQMEEALTAQRSSPDMTHVVEVRAGDTLPLLCQRIYKDPSRYLFVAAFNGLDTFRRLEPGSVINFPPIVERRS